MKIFLLSLLFFSVYLLPIFNSMALAFEPDIQEKLKKKTIKMRVKFPDFFREMNIGSKVTVKLDDSNGPLCENRGRIPGSNVIYSFLCPNNTKYSLHLEGFSPVGIIYSSGAEVVLNESEMQVVFTILRPYRNILKYWHDSREIMKQDSFTLPLDMLTDGLHLTARTITSGVTVEACSINEALSLKKILGKKEVKLRPTCETQTITWPDQWGKPESTPQFCGYSDGVLTCLKDAKGDISWGSAWLPVKGSDVLNEKSSNFLGLANLIPDWPLIENDPLLVPTTPHWDPCKARPSYKLVSIRYCREFDISQKSICKEINIAAINDFFIMPSLLEIGWNSNDPLPDRATIMLKKTSNNPKYKDKLSVSWSLAQSLPMPKKALVDSVDGMHQLLPVRTVFESQPVEYDHGARIFIFETRQGCIGSDKHGDMLEERVFLPGEIRNLRLSACTWAKVVKGNEDKTFCERGERKNGEIEFRLAPNLFKGKRKIIIVANSILLAEGGRGRAIQGALIDWLITLKEVRVPLNLFAIEGDGQVKQILRGENLRQLKPSSNEKKPPPTIAGKISNGITFSADGFRSLKDLEFVERELHVSGVGSMEKVLYFTDDTMPRTIFNYDLGTPLGWNKEGIGLTVVTIGECEAWLNRAEADCVILNKNPDKNDIKKILEDFL